MRFKYSTTDYGDDRIPLVDVILTNPDNDISIGYPAMLDSGAFMNVFHADVANLLGIDLSKIKKEIDFGGVGTAGGKLKGKPYIVNIMVAKDGKSHRFDAYVLFSKDINPNGHPLLGRLGFMDKFLKIEFDMKQGKFLLYK